MNAVCAACGAPTTDVLNACPHCGSSGAPASGEQPNWLRERRVQGALPENLAATIAYISALPAILFLIFKPYKQNAFIRFHAFQCIGIALASVGIAAIFLLLTLLTTINLLLIPVSFIAAVGIALLVLVCMIKAYQREMYKLPILGEWCEKAARRS